MRYCSSDPLTSLAAICPFRTVCSISLLLKSWVWVNNEISGRISMWGEEMRKSLIFSRNNNSSWILHLFTTILLLLSAVHYSKKILLMAHGWFQRFSRRVMVQKSGRLKRPPGVRVRLKKALLRNAYNKTRPGQTCTVTQLITSNY